MRALLGRIRSPYLAAYVALTDVLLWTAALPFELYCRSAIVQRQSDTGFLLLVLLANVVLLALIGAAAFALGELMRRGLNRPVRMLTQRVLSRIPAFVPVRSKRSGY
jgi:hypothetical protein